MLPFGRHFDANQESSHGTQHCRSDAARYSDLLGRFQPRCVRPNLEVRYISDESAKNYTYVTDLPLQVGDLVVVPAGSDIKLVSVIAVDDELKIEPNDAKKFSWVIAKVDCTAWKTNMARNKEIEDAVADAYRNNLRRSFAQQILSGVSDETRERIQLLVNGPTAQ